MNVGWTEAAWDWGCAVGGAESCGATVAEDESAERRWEEEEEGGAVDADG